MGRPPPARSGPGGYQDRTFATPPALTLEGPFRFTRRRPRTQPPEYFAPILVVLAFLLLQFLAAPAVGMTNDSYRYGRSALKILGYDRGEAQAQALAGYCADRTAAARRVREVDVLEFRQPLPADYTATCIAGGSHGLMPNAARYESIFDSRLGYPLLAAPLIDLLGLNRGLYLTSVLLTALGGVLTYVLLRAMGMTWPVAILGQVLYFVTPIGLWGTQPLAEGAVMACTVGALLGAWWMTQRRRMLGAVTLVTALVMGLLVRYSSFLMASAALTIGGLIMLWRSRSARHAGTLVMIAVNVGWVAAAAVSSRLLHWPGMGVTLQDTFTRHFHHPDVADPWRRLAELNGHLWSQWFQTQLRAPWLPLVLAVSIWAMARRGAPLAWMVTLVAATGITTVAAHPVVAQQDRLMIALWLVPVVGLPMFVSTLVSRSAPLIAPTEQST